MTSRTRESTHRRDTVTLRSDALRKLATQNENTKYFFSLPPSSVSRLVVTPAAKPKRGEHDVSTLAQGNIVAAPYEFVDQPGKRKRTIPRKCIFRRRSSGMTSRRNCINSNFARRSCVLIYPRLTFASFSPRLLTRRNRPCRQQRRSAIRTPTLRALTRKLMCILALHIPPTSTL